MIIVGIPVSIAIIAFVLGACLALIGLCIAGIIKIIEEIQDHLKKQA
jgi:hypothetical protein